MTKNRIKNQMSVGIDMEQTVRFVNKKINSPFLKRIYTPDELWYCFKKTHPSESLAGRFAAKESARKALAFFTDYPIDYKDVEIANDKSGIPMISVKNELKNKFNFSLSISHTSSAAIAVVIATLK